MKATHRAKRTHSRLIVPTVTLVLLALTSIGLVCSPSALAAFPDHKADAKVIVDKLVSGDYEGIRQNFNAQMKAGLSAEKMKEVWTAVVQQLGKYKSQGPPHSGQGPGGWEIVVIRCQMEKGELDVEVDYDTEGLVGGFWVRPLN